MQSLGCFIDFVSKHSVTRPIQNSRELVVSHSASLAELPLYGNPLSYWASTNSCSEPYFSCKWTSGNVCWRDCHSLNSHCLTQWQDPSVDVKVEDPRRLAAKRKQTAPTSPDKPACNARFSACEGSCRCAVHLLLRSLEMGLQGRSDGRLKIVVGFQIPVFPWKRKLIRVLAVAAEAGTNHGARVPFCHLRRTALQTDYSCCPGYSGHT